GGRRTGCAAFFYGTWMSRRRIPATMTARVCSGNKAFSFVSLMLTKKMNSATKWAKRCCSCLVCHFLARGKKQDQRLSPSATSFLLISVKRNGSKEKRFPDKANPAIHW